MAKEEREVVGEEEQEGLSLHSPAQAPPSSVSSLPKEQTQVELELRLLEALEVYPPAKLQDVLILELHEAHYYLNVEEVYKLAYETGIHRHFVLYGLMEHLRRNFERHFSADEVLQLLDRFFNLEMLKPDDEEAEIFNQEDDFTLPQSFFPKEEQ